AAEQSERLNIPTIADLMTLDKFLDQSLENRLPLICAEFGEAEPIFTALSRPQIKTAKKVAIITGPEGGFSIEEMKKLHELQGATALRLGPRILRADTAALAAISCWQSLYGDWK
ncbi:MAG: RsmE family RNA methyltransferase, partial [Alphaproteobacteria bacterium]|nr:RsmE family RNA methyltransferase [Alphaproteobacteria bacterium]